MVIKASILGLDEGNKEGRTLKKNETRLAGLLAFKKTTSGMTSYVTKTKRAWIESQIFHLEDKTETKHILDYLMRIISGSASDVRKDICPTEPLSQVKDLLSTSKLICFNEELLLYIFK